MSEFFNDFLKTCAAWTIEILGTIARLIPAAWRFQFVQFIGRTWGGFRHRQTRAVETNLNILFGMEDQKLKRMRLSIFENFSITLYDFFFPQKIKVHMPKSHMIDELRKKHGGILILTFHMGHWELGARVLRSHGWPVTAIYQEYTNKKFRTLVEKLRAPGVNFIPVGDSAAQGVRDALQKGDIVAMLGDHPFGEDGMAVELFGKNVIWPKGPVLLAVREKAPIVPAFVRRVAPYTYEAIVEEPLIPRNRTRAEVHRLVQEVANKFGKLLIQYPEQWYRFRAFDFVSESNEYHKIEVRKPKF